METASKAQGRRKLDLLSAVENIVELAKDSQLSPEFYHKAVRFILLVSDKIANERIPYLIMLILRLR